MKIEWTSILIDGIEVPVKIIRERRRSLRVSMGKNAVIMRFPSSLSPVDEAKHRARLEEWLHRQYAKQEGVFQRYQQADYQSGDTLIVGQRQYGVDVIVAVRKTSAVTLNGGKITLKLSHQYNKFQRSEAVRTLLSRIVASDFLPSITARVHELNSRFFQRDIKDVKLKYNHSNWGSCSNSGNINLSTRLLFAPPEVIDYVIIHELAHLVELNHSHRFWALVSRAMPDYKAKEAWLKEFGARCDF